MTQQYRREPRSVRHTCVTVALHVLWVAGVVLLLALFYRAGVAWLDEPLKPVTSRTVSYVSAVFFHQLAPGAGLECSSEPD